MITDINCWLGNWPFSVKKESFAETLALLRKYGVGKVYVSPLDAVWSRNQHAFNDEIIATLKNIPDTFPVPIIDPSLPSWEEEFARLKAKPEVKMFRAIPGYAPYPVDAMKPLCEACSKAGVPLMVQCKMEDSRGRHPLILASTETGLKPLLELKKGFPELKMIACGIMAQHVMAEAANIRDCPGIHFDTSLFDGFEVLETLFINGLGPRLLFGSHSPLLEPSSEVAKAIWLDDASAGMVFKKNASSLGL